MAAAFGTKSNIVLTLIIISITGIKNEYQNVSVDNISISSAESLLRGSDEARITINESYVAIPKTVDKEVQTDFEVQNDTNLALNENIDVNSESIALVGETTIEPQTTQVLVDRETIIGDVDEEYGLKDVESNTYEETTQTVGAAANYDTTLSVIDNNVYNTRIAEDIYSSGTDNNESRSEATTTASSVGTSQASDDMEIQVSRVDFKEVDVPGQRSPKTENSETHQPTDKRNYDIKIRPQPALSKSLTLKQWLEDTWLRPPAGILVPLRPMAINRALAVWNDLTTMEGLDLSDIVIIGYDSNGVNWRSRHNLQGSSSGSGNRAVAEALSKLLAKYQGVYTDTTSDGTMKALASAAKLVPYDSALFVVTDKGPGDPQRLPLALRALVEKRLKVYTIWTDPTHPSLQSELALQELRNISRHTEGDVLPYSMRVMDMDGTNQASEQQWEMDSQPRQARLNALEEDNAFDTILVRRGGGGATSLGVPVENGVTALRISIEGAVKHAVLYPPNDAPQIDLYNLSSIRAFSPASKAAGQSPRDIYLIFPGVNPDDDMLSVLPASLPTDSPAATVGLWHLSVRCDTCDYRLAVSARAQVHFYAYEQPKDTLKLRVTGPVASIRESLLVDEYGTELAKLPFSYQPIAGETQERHTDAMSSELRADLPLPTVVQTSISRVYAKIVGRDIAGEPYVRLSGPLNHQEIRQSRSAALYTEFSDLDRIEEENSRAYSSKLRYNESNVLPLNRATSQVVNQRGSLLTAVQIGLSTRLYGAPGDNLQLHFEVTNYREQAVRFNFEAVGELRFLRAINPTSQTVAAGQTAIVIVSLTITATAQPGARDLITFTAYGLEQVSISAYVYVINSGESVTDVWAPELRHNFQGTCIGRQGTDCAQHVWSATIIARDAIAGLLRLTSSPPGLVYDSNFISGTREEVIATYRATCCAPRVMVSAVDAVGNANSYVVDISSYYTGAAIAAIVLGVFVALALIGLIIFLIYWCVKRRRESRELPSYTTSRNVS